MKSIALLAATVMMSCSLALAQEQKPAATKPAPAEAAKPAAKPAATRMTKARRAEEARRRTEDARHCLGRPSNTEIIKCAEAYL